MRLAHILATKIPQKAFIRVHRLTGCEFICDVWEMEDEGDEIYEDDGADERGGEGGFEEICRDDRTVRERDKNEFAPAMISQNCLNFMDHDTFLQR